MYEIFDWMWTAINFQLNFKTFFLATGAIKSDVMLYLYMYMDTYLGLKESFKENLKQSLKHSLKH